MIFHAALQFALREKTKRVKVKGRETGSDLLIQYTLWGPYELIFPCGDYHGDLLLTGTI